MKDDFTAERDILNVDFKAVQFSETHKVISKHKIFCHKELRMLHISNYTSIFWTLMCLRAGESRGEHE